MKATYPVAAATVVALAVAGLSPVSAKSTAPSTTETSATTDAAPAGTTATPSPSATAAPSPSASATGSATPSPSQDGPTPVTVTVTAPAVTATPTPFRATGPSSEWINKGILDERGKEIFTYINFAITMLAGLIQALSLVVASNPRMQEQLKAMLAQAGIKP